MWLKPQHLAAAMLTLGPSLPAPAQTVQDQPLVQGPAGAVSGVFGGRGPAEPSRIAHRLIVSFDVDGGYDENADGSTPQPGALQVTGPAASGRSAVRYQWGRIGRGLDASGVLYGTRVSRWNNWPLGGGTVAAETNLGRTSGVRASLSAAYEPTYLLFSVPSASDTSVEIDPTASATQGVATQRWLAGNLAGQVFHGWSTGHRTDLQYDGATRQPLGETGLDNKNQMFQTRHVWNAKPGLGWLLTYAFQENRQRTTDGPLPPLRSNTVGTGVALVRRLSPTRTLDVALSGGLARTVAISSESGVSSVFVEPTVSFSVSSNVSRNWVVAVDAGRNVTALEGISPEPFAAVSAAARIQGVVARRFRLNVHGSYGRGAALESEVGGFSNTTGGLELQHALSPKWALSGSYTYYQHSLRDVVRITSGFPLRNERHSFRAGVTLWLPLYGSF